jgi:hypothetical protein
MPRRRAIDERTWSRVESFAFDLARLDDLLREALQCRLGAQLETERRHATEQPSLLATYASKQRSELVVLPMKLRPRFELIDVGRHSPHHARRIYALFSATASKIAAHYAENRQDNHRKSEIEQ